MDWLFLRDNAGAAALVLNAIQYGVDSSVTWAEHDVSDLEALEAAVWPCQCMPIAWLGC